MISKSLAEHVETHVDVVEVVAVGAELRLVPAGAEPGFEPSAGDVVDGDAGLRQQRRVAVGHAEHQAPDAGPFGDRRERAERGDGLEVRRGPAGRRCLVEVVPHRDPVDRPVESGPQRHQLGHRGVLLADVHTERE
jgi:hypothetical protein